MNIYKKNNIKLRNKDRNTEKIIVWCINKSLQLLTELLKAVVKLKPETLKGYSTPHINICSKCSIWPIITAKWRKNSKRKTQKAENRLQKVKFPSIRRPEVEIVF